METIEITFEETDAPSGKVTMAVLNGEQLLGKHYHSTGLSWNMPTQIRYTATLEEWKENVINYR